MATRRPPKTPDGSRPTGVPIPRGTRTPPGLLQAAGVSGLVRFGIGGPPGKTNASGYILEEWEPLLKGLRGTRTYREMRDSDPIIGAFFFAIEMLIRQVDWHLAPADDTTQAHALARFIDECLHDMEVSWPDTLSEILSFLQYGWSLHEVLYKVRGGLTATDPTHHSRFTDGAIGWRAFATRGQETLFKWEYDEHDTLTGMTQLGPPDYQFHTVPLAKSLLFRTTTYKGNPEGRSILRSAFSSYFAVKHIKQIEGIGVERDLAGLPVAYVPPQMLFSPTAEEQASLAAIQQIVTNIRRDEQEGIVWPMAYDAAGRPTYDLKLLTTGGSRQFDTSTIIERYDARLAMTVLADFILLGHEQTGTYALGSSKLGVFALALGTWLDTIAAQINDVAIPTLLSLNGWDPAFAPRLEHGTVEKADLAGLGAYLSTLSTIGVLPKDSALVQHVLALAELPVPDAATIKTFLAGALQPAVEQAHSGTTPAVGNAAEAQAAQQDQAADASSKE